jgi:hypothetical protein
MGDILSNIYAKVATYVVDLCDTQQQAACIKRLMLRVRNELWERMEIALDQLRLGKRKSLAGRYPELNEYVRKALDKTGYPNVFGEMYHQDERLDNFQ